MAKKYSGQLLFSLVIVKGPDITQKLLCLQKRHLDGAAEIEREAMETTAVMCECVSFSL